MGRRALRKIDPGLDLSSHLLDEDRLPDPWDSVALFGRAAPLEIEVGSGKGLFLAAVAAEFPQRDVLGIEISRKYARFTAAHLSKSGTDNAKILHGDALRLFHERLPESSVRAVHVYFPDPWWKKRHHKRRVMTESFVADVQRVLEPGGQLHFWTDVEDYFRASLELIQAKTQLRGPHTEPEHSPEHDLDCRTHFERRVRLLEQPVFRARFTKEKVEGRR